MVCKLQRFAPLSLAESWDNVGLLVEPTSPHWVNKMLLTNDLTESVLQEAIEERANFILSYHPPVFKPLKRLTSKNWKERLVIRCLENRMAVYSPHTSFDAMSDGVNSWLTEAFDTSSSKPISSSSSTSTPSGYTHKVEVVIPSSVASSPEVNKVLENLEELMQKQESREDVEVSFRAHESCPCLLTVRCKESKLTEIASVLTSCAQLMKHTEIFKQETFPLPGHGLGRLCQLKEPVSLSSAVKLVKKHLGLEHVRLAVGEGKTLDSKLETVAACAGSGGSVLQGVAADLYLTGEMSHHDVLDATAEGRSVILCEHSNTERGFLKAIAPQLKELMEGKVQVVCSQVDRDPLVVA